MQYRINIYESIITYLEIKICFLYKRGYNTDKSQGVHLRRGK